MNYAVLITETGDKLQLIENQQKLVQFQKRVRFLRSLKSGAVTTQSAAGQSVGWKLRQSQKIWQLYREGGLTAVLRKPQRFGFGKLSSSQIGRLQNYLAEFGAADLAEVQRVCREQFNVHYTIGGISALCIRLRIKLKTARPSNIKKDPEQAATYKKTSAG